MRYAFTLQMRSHGVIVAKVALGDEGAIADYDKAIRLDPEDTTALHNRKREFEHQLAEEAYALTLRIQVHGIIAVLQNMTLTTIKGRSRITT